MRRYSYEADSSENLGQITRRGFDSDILQMDGMSVEGRR